MQITIRPRCLSAAWLLRPVSGRFKLASRKRSVKMQQVPPLPTTSRCCCLRTRAQQTRFTRSESSEPLIYGMQIAI